MEKTYLISDAAKQVQVETHVLRYWEDELGLPIKRNKLGHRYYTKDDVEFFKEVKKMKDTGLQLKAIRMYMKDGKIIPGSITVKETQIVPIHSEVVKETEITEVLPRPDLLEDNREEKNLRLQFLLKQSYYMYHAHHIHATQHPKNSCGCKIHRIYLLHPRSIAQK